ncbi:MAG: DegT/DnrJ/EryC1/StrS family aminotransferase [Rhodospirillales bacterium]|nr:MAG: DegT/DnrJ/EryC1/StrS family aminotransferase [Rhodospirillales bacterium]
MISVPFLDLRVTDPEERSDLIEALTKVLDHGRIMLGPEVAELERRVAEYIGRSYAAGTGSGTDSLVLAWRALGIGPGDEVITTPLSFIATANAIRLNGAMPVFADIDDDLNLDPATIETMITPKTKAIVPVHWAGKVCRMEEIMAIAERHNLIVVEDASQSFGASRHGRKAGSFGKIGCFSMNSMKTFGSLGEAGMIVTDDAALREKLEALRYNGLVNREFCHLVSHNGRLDTVQAAFLLKRLDRYATLLAKRQETSDYYDHALGNVVRVPRREKDCVDVAYTYQIQCDRRDELQAYLSQQGIETKVQHKPLMPHQKAYQDCRHACPNAERLIERTLCLPVSEKVAPAQRESVAKHVRAFFGA